MFLRRFWNEWTLLHGEADAFNVLRNAAEQRRAQQAAGLTSNIILTRDAPPKFTKSPQSQSLQSTPAKKFIPKSESNDSTDSIKDG